MKKSEMIAVRVKGFKVRYASTKAGAKILEAKMKKLNQHCKNIVVMKSV